MHSQHSALNVILHHYKIDSLEKNPALHVSCQGTGDAHNVTVTANSVVESARVLPVTAVAVAPLAAAAAQSYKAAASAIWKVSSVTSVV